MGRNLIFVLSLDKFISIVLCILSVSHLTTSNVFSPILNSAFQTRRNSIHEINDSNSNYRIRHISGPTKCYGEYGCFPIDGRFQSVLRPINFFPSSPERLKVDFLLFTRVNPDGPQLIIPTVERMRASYFRRGLPVKFIIHGFTDSPDILWIPKSEAHVLYSVEEYMFQICLFNQTGHKQNQDEDLLTTHSGILTVKELLKAEDMNIIVVDWRNGAYTGYFRASSNTRLIGAMIANFIIFLRDSFSVPPSDVHLIGHSLGAQVAGYAGERVKNLGRITGLDPAQPYFENTHPAVHLDASDALFVDVVHSDSEPLLSNLHTGFGYGPPCGHVDFYLNDGESQPGCQRTIFQKLNDSGFDIDKANPDLMGCDHHRTFRIFRESLGGSCPLLGVQCSSYADFRKGRCFDCGSKGEKCARLGYYSDQWFYLFGSKMNLPVKMFLMTGTDKPYCRYHHRMIVKTSNNLKRNSAIGRLLLKFSESEEFTRIHLTKRALKFQPASTFMFVIVSRTSEPLKEFTLEWQPVRQPVPERIFSHFMSDTSTIEISSIETEGLELPYRCSFHVDAVFSIKNSKVSFNSGKCEDISVERQWKYIKYPITKSELPDNSSSNGTLKKWNFIPKPTIIPQPLFSKRNQALSYLLNPFIERLFSRN